MKVFRFLFLAGAALATGLSKCSFDTASFASMFHDPVTSASDGGGSDCISGTIPLPIVANVTALNYTIDGNSDPAQQQAFVTQTLADLLAANSTLPSRLNRGQRTIRSTYGIWGRVCVPRNVSTRHSAVPSTLQILTHGATSDHHYWDIRPGFSYVDAATAKGYITFDYDQLGVGRSERPDPIQVAQYTSQVAVVHSLAQLFRARCSPASAPSALSVQAPRRIRAPNSTAASEQDFRLVGVAHSAGSFVLNTATAAFPHDFDALVFTGASIDSSYLPVGLGALDLVIAATQNGIGSGAGFTDLQPGYLVYLSRVGAQFAFFHYPDYDNAAAVRLNAVKQTVSLGFLITIQPLMTVSEFRGPVDVVTGEFDVLFCKGDCDRSDGGGNSEITDFQRQLYPNAARGSQYFVVPGAGHTINPHFQAPASFEHINAFLKTNGLVGSRVW